MRTDRQALQQIQLPALIALGETAIAFELLLCSVEDLWRNERRDWDVNPLIPFTYSKRPDPV